MKENHLPSQTLKKEDIEQAHKIAAEVVYRYGDKYLPIFERMHQELAKLETHQKMKSLAFQHATSIIKEE